MNTYLYAYGELSGMVKARNFRDAVDKVRDAHGHGLGTVSLWAADPANHRSARSR